MNDSMTLWQPESDGRLPDGADTPQSIIAWAKQLKPNASQQIVNAYQCGHYEMGLNFLWLKTVAVLKQELKTVGVQLLCEMLDRPEIQEDEDVDSLLTGREAITLAEELGVVSPTYALRLRHTDDLLSHFSRLDIEDSEPVDIEKHEAMASLKACVISVLGKPKVEVAREFVDFRRILEEGAISSNDETVQSLCSSPYFFLRLTVKILMNSAKTLSGAKLEHCLANTNVLLPALWPRLQDSDKWYVGSTYAVVYSDGKKTSTGGLREALLKVSGFDFVPENLRSNTFVKAAGEILRAHDGMNNYYTEPAAVRHLGRLGTSIPVPALSACMTALLSVTLGNLYGHSWSGAANAEKLLDGLSPDRWRSYLDQVLPGDTRILRKLNSTKPRERWRSIVQRYELAALPIKNTDVANLVSATDERDDRRIDQLAKKLCERYYRGSGK